MWRHISAHRATTKYSSNSFVFKPEIEKEGLPGDITPALGAGGLRFKSGRPDQFISFVYRHLAALAFWCHLPCGLLPGRRSDFATYSIPMISMYGNQTKTPGGKSASRKLLNWRELSGHFLLVWGKMWGPCALLGGLAHGRTCISADRRDVRCCGPPNCYPSRSMKSSVT